MGETPQGLDSLFCEKYESKSAKPFASKTFTADQKDEVESVNTELTVSKSIRKSSFPSIFTSDLCSKKHATLVMHTPSELTKQLTNMMSLTRKSIKKSSC